MRLIKPSFEILEQLPGKDGMLKHIELCGRVAYKSEDKITEESAPKFVDMLINRNHTAVLEHGTVYLQFNYSCLTLSPGLLERYRDNRFTYINYGLSNFYITTNYRVLIQNGWLEDLKYQCEPTEYHSKRITVKFLIDRGVSHEFVRHRVFSFVQESTRFCNYSKEQFGNELTFIEPLWLDKIDDDTYSKIYLSSIQHSESAYLDLLKQWDSKIPDKRYKSGYKNNPWTPQQARSVLPNSLKTELIMTATIEEWKGFFKLRCAKDAHPSAREVAIPLEEKFKELVYE